MRGVAGRLFAFSSIGSLLLCVAACLAWARSYWRADSRAQWFTSPTGEYGGFIRTDHWYWHSGILYGTRAVERGSPAGGALNVIKWSHEVTRPKTIAPGPRFEYRKWASPGRSQVVSSYSRLRAMGLVWRLEATQGYSRQWSVQVPMWMLALTFAGLPLTRLLVNLGGWSRRRRRTAHGLCPTCGYDLRGTPDRCPECGSGRKA